MAEEIVFPAKIKKNIFLVLAAFGFGLYTFWTFYYLIPDDRYFDIGIFSLCLCIFLFGVAGVWLYSNLEKKQKKEAKE